MSYDADQCTRLIDELHKTQIAFDEVLLQSIRASDLIEDRLVKVYLNEGVGRRIGILKHCLANIYRQFPPDRSSLLTKEEGYDVQIALHAFVMNLYGVFENLAWAFVIRHDLLPKLKKVNKVGMFSKEVQALMPQVITNYLISETMSSWSKSYLKNYRDSLAHRIPLYIPPAMFSNEQANRYSELDRLEIKNLRARNWDELQKNQEERDALGSPSFMFLTSSMENTDLSPKPIYLHPQLLCDAATLIEFSPVFFTHWHQIRVAQEL